MRPVGRCQPLAGRMSANSRQPHDPKDPAESRPHEQRPAAHARVDCRRATFSNSPATPSHGMWAALAIDCQLFDEIYPPIRGLARTRARDQAGQTKQASRHSARLLPNGRAGFSPARFRSIESVRGDGDDRLSLWLCSCTIVLLPGSLQPGPAQPLPITCASCLSPAA